MTKQNNSDDTKKPEQPAGERARDEQRDGGGPRYGGGEWSAADERGEKRFGVARNDDADPSTLVKADPDVESADENVEHGGEHAGMVRGEKPRKSRRRGKGHE